MPMNDFLEKQPSPWMSLVLLLVYTVAFSIGIQILALLIGELNGSNIQDFISGSTETATGNSRFFMYALLACGTFGTFYLPAVVLQKREPMFQYFPTENAPVAFYALAVAFLVAFAPMMGLIAKECAQ